MDARFERQQQARCLQHAFNNGWSAWVALHRRIAPGYSGMLQLNREEEWQPQEIVRLSNVTAPDGHRMSHQLLSREVLEGMMPVLRQHLDLAVVYKGRANVMFKPGQTVESKHFTALVQVDGLHFELESLGGDWGSCWRFVPDLGEYFRQFGGEVLLAVRGEPSHPLAPYLSALQSQRFRRVCEELGPILGGGQAILDLTDHVVAAGGTAYDIDAVVVADFLNSKGIASSIYTGIELSEELSRPHVILERLELRTRRQTR